MKILITTTSYPLNESAWQGQFVRNLIYALSNKKNLEILLWGPPGETPGTVEYCATEKEKFWLEKLLNEGGIASLIRTKPLKGIFSALKLLYNLRNVYHRNKQVDIIHVNWLQNSIPLIYGKCPVIISVLGSDFNLLKLPGMVPVLRTVFRNRKTILCPNAKWMTESLHEHFGDVATVVHVPYGIDQSFFELNAYLNKSKPNKWLAIIRVTESKIGNLFTWGEKIFSGNNELHLLGPMQENVNIPKWCHYHGPTNPKELVRDWLPSAAGLITLSQHSEGLPQIILEAMAAGVPVIASDIPGHTTVVQHKKTGFIVTSESSLKEGIEWLSESSNREYVAHNAKHWVKDNIGTWDDCADKFINLYNSIE